MTSEDIKHQLISQQPKLQALVYDILSPLEESDARSVVLVNNRLTFVAGVSDHGGGMYTSLNQSLP